jgi:hypothetical protein
VAHAGRSKKKKPADGRVEDSGDVRPSRRLSGNAFYHRKRRTAADVLVSPRKLPFFSMKRWWLSLVEFARSACGSCWV